MATHSEIKDQAIRSRDRDIAFLKQQLAEALQQLQEQRIAIRADVIEQAKAEARNQAFEDAIAAVQSEQLEDPNPNDDGDGAYGEAIRDAIEALLRERGK